MAYRYMLVLVALISLAALPGRAAIEFPKAGEVDPKWFGDNPYAADSSVHAYVIAQAVNTELNIYGGSKTSTRRIVRMLDRRGYD